MSLREILERLERIEQLTVWCARCDLPCTDDERREALTALRLDVEAYLIRTTGTV